MATLEKSKSHEKNLRLAFLVYAAVCLITLVTIVFFFWVLPSQQLNAIRESLEPKDVLEFQNEIRLELAQTIGGASVLLGLFVALRITSKYLNAKQKFLQGSQSIESIILANEQLGS